jgi:hypothetical protein
MRGIEGLLVRREVAVANSNGSTSFLPVDCCREDGRRERQEAKKRELERFCAKIHSLPTTWGRGGVIPTGGGLLGVPAIGNWSRRGFGFSIPGGSDWFLSNNILEIVSLLQLFGVTVEEEINGNFPSGVSGDGTSDAEDLTGEQPVEKTNRELSLVVAWNATVNILQRGIRITEGDHRNVHIGSLLDGLGINSGISDDQEARLLELFGDLISESSWSESSGNALRTSVLGELQDSSLSIRTSRDTDNVLWVLNGSNDSGSKDDLLPSLAKVQ